MVLGWGDNEASCVGFKKTEVKNSNLKIDRELAKAGLEVRAPKKLLFEKDREEPVTNSLLVVAEGAKIEAIQDKKKSKMVSTMKTGMVSMMKPGEHAGDRQMTELKNTLKHRPADLTFNSISSTDAEYSGRITKTCHRFMKG